MNHNPNIEDLEYLSIPETKRPLKYRGISGNTDLWVSEMSRRDSQLWGMQVPLWVIDNNVYDLRQFMDIHPGGRSWLQLTKGQDITVLFKIHHLDTLKCSKILQKYYISPTSRTHPQRFQFKQGDDYSQIKAKILQKYTIKQLTSSTMTQIRCYCIILLWFILFNLCGYIQSYILAIICGCLLISFYGIGHLFIHKSDHNNILKHIYLLLGFSAKQQQIIHAISHHPHPNTMLDYQFSGMQPIVQLSKCQPITSWYNSILAQIFVLFTAPGNALNKLIFGPLLGKEKFNAWYAVIFVQIFYLYALGSDIWVAVGLWGVMVGVYGFLVGKMLLCSHRQPQLWSQGNPQIPNYFHHILSTTTDTTSTPIHPFLSILLYSSFNLHIIHHLFPTIDHNKLSECNEILIEYCKQNNLYMGINKNMIDCNLKMYNLRKSRKIFVFQDFVGGGRKEV